MWLRVILAIIGLFLLLIIAGAAYLWFMPFPAANPQPQATVVYDSSGHVLATFSEQFRVDVPLRKVPAVVVNAVVSTEDRHFFTEGAVNPVSIGRAAITDLSGHGLQGGSTITQQYVKQMYLSPSRTVVRKFEEIVLAVRLSQKDSKKQILQGYLNTIYWGRGAYGVEAASRVYFGKDVSRLGLPEASLLAALIRDPEAADPALNPSLARQQQTETLKAMVRDKKITPAQAAVVEKTPFSAYVLPPPSQVSKVQASTMGNDYFLSAVRQELYAKYGRQVVDGGGLRVTTTFDPTLQREAYGTVYGHNSQALNPAAGDPSAAIVSLDDYGNVKALVGGQNYSASSVDLALGKAGGGSGRQAGSTFKAFMLAALIKDGYSVRSVLPAPPKVIVPGGDINGKPWAVTNYEGEATAPQMNLIDATAKSVNTVYAQVVAKLGARRLDSMAEAMGISPAELPAAFDSQVLGSADVSPLEMAAGYSTLADGGVYHTPILVTKVTTASGRRLPLPITPQSRRVLTPEQAATATYVLQQVVANGTGTAAGGVGSQVAGKTGTTQNAGDAWFIGYTPKLTTAIWMGYANAEKSMDGFRGLGSVAGGTLPAEFWHKYMLQALTSYPQYRGSFPAAGSLAGKPLVPFALNGDVVEVGTPASNPKPLLSPPPSPVFPAPSTTPQTTTTSTTPTSVPPTTGTTTTSSSTTSSTTSTSTTSTSTTSTTTSPPSTTQSGG
jgi:penicillin-binding protein 1A